MTDLENYIQSTFGVVNQDLEVIVSKFKHSKMEKGEYWLQSGMPCNKLSFIGSGLLRIYVNLDGREVTQWISTKGYFVTDLSSLVFQIPARWTIQALTDCELYTIDRDTYNNLGKEIPKWYLLDKLFIAKCFTMLEDRIFSHLYMTAEERYQMLFEKQPELFNQVPLQYLASMLGMTPETMSRIRKKA